MLIAILFKETKACYDLQILLSYCYQLSHGLLLSFQKHEHVHRHENAWKTMVIKKHPFVERRTIFMREDLHVWDFRISSIPGEAYHLKRENHHVWTLYVFKKRNTSIHREVYLFKNAYGGHNIGSATWLSIYCTHACIHMTKLSLDATIPSCSGTMLKSFSGHAWGGQGRPDKRTQGFTC